MNSDQNLSVFPIKIANQILLLLSTAPTSQLDPKWKSKIDNVKNKSLRDQWNLFCEIAQLPETEVSSFVKELCSVSKSYLEPEYREKLI